MSGLTTIMDALTGRTARVDEDNRLKVNASAQPRAVDEALAGGAFIITTGSLNLTSDSMSHVLYAKNNEDVSWVINAISMSVGATDGAGDSLVQFTIGAVGGTLLTAGTDMTPINLNLGESKQLTVTAKKGAEGSSVSGGLAAAPTLVPSGTIARDFPAKPIILAPGSSLAVGFQPPTGSTSMNIQFQLPIYRSDS